jgi:rubrerythrin
MADITEKLQDFFTNAHVNVYTLKNVLSEFLAVEIGGQKLYERALELVSDSEVRTKFREFHRQTVEHQKVLTDIIRKLGGDPGVQSTTAKVAAEKAQGLLRTMSRAGLSKDENELNAIENIVLAETKDHADWELIGKIVRQTTDQRLREVLGPAAKAIEQEEDEHLNWTRKKLGDLQMVALGKSGNAEKGSKALSETSKRPKRVGSKSAKSSKTGGKKGSKPVASDIKERRSNHSLPET